VGQIRRIGGVAQLVVHHRHAAVLPGQTKHRLDKVVARVAVQPRRTHNEIVRAELLYILLAQQLCFAVDRARRGQVVFPDGLRRVAAEHIVRGDMHQLCADLLRGHGQVARTQGIHRKGRLPVCFAAVHIGERRAGNDGVRRVMAHIGSHLVAVCDVQRVHVRGKHGGALQLCGQGPQLRFSRGNAPAQLCPKLPVRTCDEYFHNIFLFFCFALHSARRVPQYCSRPSATRFRCSP